MIKLPDPRLRRSIAFVVVAVVVASVLVLAPHRIGDSRVSEFGHYAGFSEPTYDGNRRTSDYLMLADGTKLAYDLIVPSRKGVATKWLERLVRHGYAVIVIERSGTGASSGAANLSHEFAAKEADQILNWIAAQPEAGQVQGAGPVLWTSPADRGPGHDADVAVHDGLRHTGRKAAELDPALGRRQEVIEVGEFEVKASAADTAVGLDK